MRARTGLVVLMTALCATGVQAKPRHPAHRHAPQPAPLSDPIDLADLEQVMHGAVPAPPAARRWQVGPTNAAYETPAPDSIHFDVNGARIKLRGAGLKMKMPIG